MNIRNRISSVPQTVRSINWKSRKTLSILAGALILAGLVGYRTLSGPEVVVETEESLREVEIARVQDLMSGGSSLSIVGKIESRSEAEVRAETGGRITRVYASLGQTVGAGKVLAELENSAQRAAVLQAEGAYDAAKAALAKVQGGTRDEQLAILQSAQNAAKSGAVNALLSAYASADNAITDTADQMISNPKSANPQFNVSTAYSQAKLDIENTRNSLNALLARYENLSSTLDANDDLANELTKMESELRDIRAFMDTILKALNAGVSSPSISDATIAVYKAEASGARTALTASLSAIASARNGLEVAQKNLEQGQTGAQVEDVSASTAQLKSAQGSYNAALANLEKTIIRAPISGTLNNFTPKVGAYVSPSEQVAVISNNGSLEAVAFVTEDDKTEIAVGNAASIEGGLAGTITRIAPAIDPTTGRIEVRISLSTAAASELVNGETVRIALSRNKSGKTQATRIMIPITAIKMESNRDVVFEVNAENKLVARPVEIGAFSGNSIEITSGISVDSLIVVDARGLKENDEVAIAETN